jgi:hypothetical protein
MGSYFGKKTSGGYLASKKINGYFQLKQVFNSGPTVMWTWKDPYQDEYGRSSIGGLACNSSGVYVADGGGTRKVDRAGETAWSVKSNNRINAIAVDTSGYVYSSGYVDDTVTKFDANGVKKWSRVLGNSIYTIDFDTAGTLTAYTSEPKIYRINPSNGAVNASKITDPWGNGYPVYGNGAVTFGAIYTLSQSSMLVYSPDALNYINQVTGLSYVSEGVATKNFLYINNSNAGVAQTDGQKIIWQRSVTGNVLDLAADPAGNVYACTDKGLTYKFNESGQRVWVWNIPANERAAAIAADNNYAYVATDNTITMLKQ